MRAQVLTAGIVCLATSGICVCTSLAQLGVAERVGERLDDVGRGLRRGAEGITDTIKKRFEVVRADVNRMEAQPRVYSRIHWDKSLHTSKIEVHLLRDGTVLLRGYVPDVEAKKRAVALASATVGVTAVVDELTPLAPPIEEVKPAATRTPK
jgi:hypothetical protein